jgi:phage tail sheath protein FI
MAVLSLPEHYRDDDATAHAQLLASTKATPLWVHDAPVEALSAGELEALGFASLYHGWLSVRDEGGILRTQAPDGAACGVIARRANERGAWIAPANESLRGIVALARPTPPARWLELQQVQVNVTRQGPNGFVMMSADTLARDEDVRPISVRRLLILLRRLAVRHGATYVFEPNDDVFRRMVQRGFEAILGDLFERGAFAGSTAATSFQVVTGGTLNTRQSVEQGRFIVELRVAPSRPMVFLTIRLVQTGEHIAVTGA